MEIEPTRAHVDDQGEPAIRVLIDRLVKAVRSSDVDGVMSAYAPELVAFDLVPPLQYVGAEAFMKAWRDVFESYREPIHYELRDLSITAGDDVAFSHSRLGNLRCAHSSRVSEREWAKYRSMMLTAATECLDDGFAQSRTRSTEPDQLHPGHLDLYRYHTPGVPGSVAVGFGGSAAALAFDGEG